MRGRFQDCSGCALGASTCRGSIPGGEEQKLQKSFRKSHIVLETLKKSSQRGRWAVGSADVDGGGGAAFRASSYLNSLLRAQCAAGCVDHYPLRTFDQKGFPPERNFRRSEDQQAVSNENAVSARAYAHP